MSAREAYIAGRSGAPKAARPSAPKSGGPAGGPTREQRVFDAGQQERERAQIIKEEGIYDLSQRQQEQAKTIAEKTGKDPYNLFPRKPTKIEEIVDKGADAATKVMTYGSDWLLDPVVDTGQNLYYSLSPRIQAALGLGKGLKTLFGGVAPTREQLQDPNFLAIMNEVLKGDQKTDQFVDKYKKQLEDAGYYSDERIKQYTEDLKTHLPNYPELVEQFLEKAKTIDDFKESLREAEIPQGSEAQRRLEPWNYYNPDLYEGSQEQAEALEGYPEFLTSMGLEPTSSRFALTSGNLEKIASVPLDSIPYDEQGRKFRRQVIAAREQVQRDRTQDRMNMPGQYPGGGGAGIQSLAAVPTPFTDVNNNGILDNLEVAQATTTPAITATTATPATTTAATTPTPFDYLSWPQYTQQGIASPNLNPWYNTLQNYYGVG